MQPHTHTSQHLLAEFSEQYSLPPPLSLTEDQKCHQSQAVVRRKHDNAGRAANSATTSPQTSRVSEEEENNTARKKMSADHRSPWKQGAADSWVSPGSRITTARIRRTRRRRAPQRKHTKPRFRGERAAACRLKGN